MAKQKTVKKRATTKKKKLRDISDIRRFFHRNESPIYFISATNFNLLGIDEWVKNFKYITYIDCYDGRHPNVIVPSPAPKPDFESIEDINNYLLQHKEVMDLVKSRRGRPKAATFLMFDKTTETLARKLGLQVWFPKASLRSKLDNKIETVRVGNKAGVPSVPNLLAELTSYEQMRQVSKKLGQDLVLQTAFGDSGHTTFFISNEKDWKRHADEIVGEGEVKIMKRISCRQAAIEACTTKAGTIVGPLMTEIVGFKELTPYKGGWAGNEIFRRCLHTQAAQSGPRPDLPVRRATAQGGLPRLFRARLPDRQGHRGNVAGRTEPAGHRRQLHDQPCCLCTCRCAAVPVPLAGVQRRGLRP